MVYGRHPTHLPLAVLLCAFSAASVDAAVVTAPITFNSYYWVASVGFGTPPTNYTLLCDSGSGFIWTGANTSRPYVRTNSSQDTGNPVSVAYGGAGFSGEEYLDTVTLAPSLRAVLLTIGGANATGSAFASYGVDGLLGLSPSYPSQTTSTVMDTLFQEKSIEEQVFSLSYAPPDASNLANGTITFGGVDPTYAGDVVYIPMSTVSYLTGFWGLEMTGMSYGSTNISTTGCSGIIDSGAPGLELPSDWLETYEEMISAAGGNGSAPTESLNFIFGDVVLPFTAQAQLTSTIVSVGHPANQSNSGCFVLGYPFLERYFAVFDQTNSRIGFGNTSHTFS